MNIWKNLTSSRVFPSPPLELGGDPSRKRIYLPPPGDLNTGEIDLRRAIEGRISLRSFRDIPISLEDLSLLLWFTQGVREKHPEATLRNVPSAGCEASSGNISGYQQHRRTSSRALQVPCH